MKTTTVNIACRTPGTNPDWWAADATPEHQAVAATLCMGCPAIQACDQYRRDLGTDAAGTYAAVHQPLIDAETDAEFLEIAAALGWDEHLAEHPTMRDTESTGWEQLALWGPSVRTDLAGRRRRVRPSRSRPSSRRTPVPAHTAGA